MCSGFTHQHTVEETHPRSQTVKPSLPSSPLRDSILPSLSLNTLPLAKLSFGFFFSFLRPPPSLPLHYQPPFPSPCLGLPPHSPEDSIMLSLLVSLMSFTCQQRTENARAAPQQRKNTLLSSQKMLQGGGRWGRGAWREIDRGDRGNEIMRGKQDKKGNVEGRG